MFSGFKIIAKLALVFGSFFTPLLDAQTSLARADEFLQPHSFADYDSAGSTLEDGVYVEGVKIRWANFPKIRKLYPEVARFTDAQITAWLEHSASFIGSEQPSLMGIRISHAKIDTTKTEKIFRPKGWERSGIVEAKVNGKTIGVFDIKGIGHGKQTTSKVAVQLSNFRLAESTKANAAKLSALRTADHSDGVIALGEAIAERSRQAASQILFERGNTMNEFVDALAIAEMPYDILGADGYKKRAAVVVREPNLGRFSDAAVDDAVYTDPTGGKQRTRFGTNVDGGGIMIQDKRLEPTFGTDYGSKEPWRSRPWLSGHEEASKIASGQKVDLNEYFASMLKPLSDTPLTEEEKLNVANHRAYQNAMFEEEKRLRHLPMPERFKALQTFQASEPHFLASFEKCLSSDKDYNYVIRMLDRTNAPPIIFEKALQSKTSNYAIYAANKLRYASEPEYGPAAEIAVKSQSKLVREAGEAALQNLNVRCNYLPRLFPEPGAN